MPSADDIVKFIICLWFAFGLLAALSLFFDRFLKPFISKFYVILYFTPYKTLYILMLTHLILPRFGLLDIYYTFRTLLSYISNKFLLILFTVLVIFLQIMFVDLILPNNTKSSTKYFNFQYIYPLWQYYFSEYLPKS